MDLSIEQNRFNIEHPALGVKLIIQPRRSIEDDETLVFIETITYPTFVFRVELRPTNKPVNWRWNGSARNGKLIARQAMTHLRSALTQAHEREGRHSQAHQFRQLILKALPKA